MTVTYPIISPVLGELGDPAWAADITEAANDHEDRVGVLETGSYVGEDTEATTNTTSTGTETFSGATVTFTASSTERYKVTFSASVFSTVLGDVSRLRIRYQSGASVTSSGTQVKIKTTRHEVASSGQDFSIFGTFTGVSGQYTVGVSIQRVAGTGTCTISANSTDEVYILIERIS